jgi:hypothetical protein
MACETSALQAGGTVKTPQEKKRLSYALDRRNTYGEHDKSSRSSIARSKTHAIRVERRAQNQPLAAAVRWPDTGSGLESAAVEDALVAADLAVKSTPPRRWKKSADTPLGQLVAERLRRKTPPKR